MRGSRISPLPVMPQEPAPRLRRVSHDPQVPTPYMRHHLQVAVPIPSASRPSLRGRSHLDLVLTIQPALAAGLKPIFPFVTPWRLTPRRLDSAVVEHRAGTAIESGDNPGSRDATQGARLVFPSVARTAMRPRGFTSSVPESQLTSDTRGLSTSAEQPTESALAAGAAGSGTGELREPETEFGTEEVEPPGTSGSSSLLQWFWDTRTGLSGFSSLSIGGRSCVVLVDEDTVDDGLGLLVYSLHQISRCTCGDAMIQWVGGEDLHWTLAGGRVTQVDPALVEISAPGALIRRFKELAGGRPSVVVSPDRGDQLPAALLETPGFDIVRLRRRSETRARAIAVLAWAFGNLAPEALGIDEAARELEESFMGKLRSYQRRVDPRCRRRSVTASGSESPEHYWAKMYLAWLHRHQRVTVEPVEAHTFERIPDVRVDDGPLYYEVETFYGAGDPVAKLNETVEKYGTTEQVRVVVLNPQAMLFLPDLLRAERALQKEKRGLSLWTLDLSQDNAVGEQGLRLLRKVAQELRSP